MGQSNLRVAYEGQKQNLVLIVVEGNGPISILLCFHMQLSTVNYNASQVHVSGFYVHSHCTMLPIIIPPCTAFSLAQNCQKLIYRYFIYDIPFHYAISIPQLKGRGN